MKTKKNAEFSHIYKEPNPNFLQNLGKNLFKLDPGPLSILTILSKEGSLTGYQLAKRTSQVTRFSVRRWISNPKGLLDLGYIYETKGEKHRTGTTKRPFNLTFKGFMASLSNVNFEDTLWIKNYQKRLEKYSDFKMSEFAVQYMKYNLAVILFWHQLNGLELTNQRNNVNYFSYFNIHYLYDNFPFNLEYVKNQNLLNEFSTIRAHFLALQIAMAKLLLKRELKHKFTTYEFSIIDKKIKQYSSKTFLYNLIKDWINSIEYVQYVSQKSIPLKIGYSKGNILHVDVANDLSNQLLSAIFDIKKLKSSSISII